MIVVQGYKLEAVVCRTVGRVEYVLLTAETTRVARLDRTTERARGMASIGKTRLNTEDPAPESGHLEY